MRMMLLARFDHVEESFREFQFKKICLPVKTSCPSAEKVNDTPGPWGSTLLKQGKI